MRSLPLLVIAGWSGAGKTTLLRRLLPLLADRGLEVAVAKHHGEDLETDRPGKDSMSYRRAGALPSLLVGPHLVTAWRERRADRSWWDEVRALAPEADLCLCEGFKSSPLPRIEVLGKGPLLADDGLTLARLRPHHGAAPSLPDDRPLFAWEALHELADFVRDWCEGSCEDRRETPPLGARRRKSGEGIAEPCGGSGTDGEKTG